MRYVLIRAGVVALACVLVKLAASLVVMPAIGGRLDPVNWFWFILSPALVAMPAATYFFWKDEQLRRALVALKRAHVDLGRAHQRLGEQARRDSMTGLLNRDSFIARFESLRGRTGSGALLIVDADHFKKINDTHGHMTGDAALLEITAALRRSIRDRDIAGRIGGEEFGVFLADAGAAEATVVAERIRQAVAAVSFSPAPGITLDLTVSIGGVSAAPGPTTSELLRMADDRLYEAKRTGRNSVVICQCNQAKRASIAA